MSMMLDQPNEGLYAIPVLKAGGSAEVMLHDMF